jgi:hypothetical protein
MMIEDLDEALRQLLIREIPIKNGEVEIAFEQPKREWSSRLSRPTLNMFLYDMHENTKLRQQPGWHVASRNNGQATQERPPMRVDLHYMVTAWAAEAEDEHRLLTRSLMALARFETLPEDILPESLQAQPVPIMMEVAQPTALQNATDIWSVLDNEIRPAIACKITLALSPYVPVTGPLVRTRELRFEQVDDLAGTSTPSRGYWTVGGTVHTEQSLEQVKLTLVERGTEIPLADEGRFVIGNLEAGNYTLEVAVKGRKPKRHKIAVPAPDYDLNV